MLCYGIEPVFVLVTHWPEYGKCITPPHKVIKSFSFQCQFKPSLIFDSCSHLRLAGKCNRWQRCSISSSRTSPYHFKIVDRLCYIGSSTQFVRCFCCHQ